MSQFLIGILFFLAFTFIISLFSGTINIIAVSAVALLYYFIFLVFYSLIYLIIRLVNKNPLPESIKGLVVILTTFPFLGYIGWDYYIQNKDEKDRINKYKESLIEKLGPLPSGSKFWANYNSFYVSTNNSTKRKNNVSTFKWGDLELTELKTLDRGRLEAISTNQPKELPHGIKCNSKLYFERKDKDYKQDSDSRYDFSEYQFTGCEIKDLELSINKQKISLFNLTLQHRHNLLEKQKIVKHENLDLIANNLGLNNDDYWFTKLPGYARVGDEWVVDNIIVFINKNGEAIGITGSGESKNGLNRVKVQQCTIKSSNLNMLLTNLDNEKLSFHVRKIINNDRVLYNCPEVIDTSFHYFNEELEKDYSTLKTQKANHIDNKIKLLIRDFSNIDNNSLISWYGNIPRLREIASRSDKPFSWNELKITNLFLSKDNASVYLHDSERIKLGDFICDKTISFSHIERPIDNSLNKNNFILTGCYVSNIMIKINNKNIIIKNGMAKYYDSDKINKPKNNKKNTKLEYQDKIAIESHTPILVIEVDGNIIHINKAITNRKGEVISLSGLNEKDDKKNISLGSCKYDYDKLIFTLSHFEREHVNISLSIYSDIEMEKTNCAKKSEKQRYKYKIIQ